MATKSRAAEADPKSAAEMDKRWEAWSRGTAKDLSELDSLLEHYRIIAHEIKGLQGARSSFGEKITRIVSDPHVLDAIKRMGGHVTIVGDPNAMNREISVTYKGYNIVVKNDLRLNSRGIEMVKELLTGIGVELGEFQRLSVDRIAEFLASEYGTNEEVTKIVEKLEGAGIASRTRHIRVVDQGGKQDKEGIELRK